jgi:hypothetical protein
VTGAEFRGVDIDLLADYIGGALSGTPDESAVSTLIADDPAWRAAYESLSGGMAAVRAELGRFEAEPMPADVADRIDEALTTTPRLTLLIDPDPVPERQPAKRSRRMRWVTPIAVAAGTVALVGFSLDYLAGREESQSDSASSAGLADSGDAAARKEAAAPAQANQAGGFTLLATGTDYSASTLTDMASQALSATASDVPRLPAPDRGGAAGPLARLHGATALADCLNEIAAANAAGPITTQTVDFARFDGAPAIVVRFTAANGAWAWASGPSCGAPGSGAATLASMPVR